VFAAAAAGAYSSAKPSAGCFVQEQAGISTLHLRQRPISFGVHIMRQPNYAFERTVKQQRNHLRHRAAAQRER
jgi:3'-phosphoadenosine 5'-phosphosulfate (PAPS) 3'-phosphatase